MVLMKSSHPSSASAKEHNIDHAAKVRIRWLVPWNLRLQDALTDAQQLGYAEADPTFDIQGIDAAHKLTNLENWLNHE